jgi:RNA polymerase sigma factor (sigma-70 family)
MLPEHTSDDTIDAGAVNSILSRPGTDWPAGSRERTVVVAFLLRSLHRLRAVAAIYVGRDLAQDVVQDLFLGKLDRILDAFRPERCRTPGCVGLFAFVRYSVASAARSSRRTKARREARWNSLEALPPEATSDGSREARRLRQTVTASLIQRAMSSVLTPVEATLLAGHHFHGYSLRELAARLTIPETHVRTHLRRGTAKLLTHLDA